MKEITLTKGYKTIVDDADYELIKAYKWRVVEANGKAYAVTWMNGRHVYLHRYLMNSPEGKLIEFINGDRLDNRRENIRAVTKTQKQRSKNLSANNTTGYKGVSFNKKAGKYKASIRHKGKLIYLGLFPTAEKASEAYNRKARKLIGCR